MIHDSWLTSLDNTHSYIISQGRGRFSGPEIIVYFSWNWYDFILSTVFDFGHRNKFQNSLESAWEIQVSDFFL